MRTFAVPSISKFTVASFTVSVLEPLLSEYVVDIELPTSINCPPSPFVKTRLGPSVLIILVPMKIELLDKYKSFQRYVLLPKSYEMFADGNNAPVNIPLPGTERLPEVWSNVKPVLPVNSPLSSNII